MQSQKKENKKARHISTKCFRGILNPMSGLTRRLFFSFFFFRKVAVKWQILKSPHTKAKKWGGVAKMWMGVWDFFSNAPCKTVQQKTKLPVVYGRKFSITLGLRNFLLNAQKQFHVNSIAISNAFVYDTYIRDYYTLYQRLKRAMTKKFNNCEKKRKKSNACLMCESLRVEKIFYSNRCSTLIEERSAILVN